MEWKWDVGKSDEPEYGFEGTRNELSRYTAGRRGVSTGCRNPGSVNIGRIDCGCDRAPIEDIVAVLRLWRGGRTVAKKKRSILSTSMDAICRQRRRNHQDQTHSSRLERYPPEGI